jgi:hypothetical protein
VHKTFREFHRVRHQEVSTLQVVAVATVLPAEVEDTIHQVAAVAEGHVHPPEEEAEGQEVVDIADRRIDK